MKCKLCGKDLDGCENVCGHSFEEENFAEEGDVLICFVEEGNNKHFCSISCCSEEVLIKFSKNKQDC